MMALLKMKNIILFLSIFAFSACVETPKNYRSSGKAERPNDGRSQERTFFSIMQISDNKLTEYPLVLIDAGDIKLTASNGEYQLDIGFKISGNHGTHFGVRTFEARPAPGELSERTWGDDTVIVPAVSGQTHYRAKFILIDPGGGHYTFPAYWQNRIQIRSYELDSDGHIANSFAEAVIYIYIIEEFNAANEVVGHKVTDKWAEYHAWVEKRDQIDHAQTQYTQPAPPPPPVPSQQSAPQPQPAPRPQPAPQPQPASRPQPAPQPQPAPRPQPAPQPQPAPRPQPAPQPQPALRPQPAPQPQPASRYPETQLKGMDSLSLANKREWKVCNDARWAAWYETKEGRIAKLNLDSMENSDPSAYHYMKREKVIHYDDHREVSWTTKDVERVEKQYGVWLPKSRMAAMLEEGLRPDFAPNISDRNDPKYRAWLRIQNLVQQADNVYTTALHNAALWLFGKEKMESKKGTSPKLALRINFPRDLPTPEAYDKLYKMFNYHKTYCGHRACEIDINRQRTGPSPCSPQ